MSSLDVTVRIDVLAALRRNLLPGESIDTVIEDLAYLEARARFTDPSAGDRSLSCTMSGPLVALTVSIPDVPLRMLTSALRPGETLDGLVTALMIGEVRYRRTSLIPYVVSADEEVMPEDLAELDALIHSA